MISLYSLSDRRSSVVRAVSVLVIRSTGWDTARCDGPKWDKTNQAYNDELYDDDH